MRGRCVWPREPVEELLAGDGGDFQDADVGDAAVFFNGVDEAFAFYAGGFVEGEAEGSFFAGANGNHGAEREAVFGDVAHNAAVDGGEFDVDEAWGAFARGVFGVRLRGHGVRASVFILARKRRQRILVSRGRSGRQDAPRVRLYVGAEARPPKELAGGPAEVAAAQKVEVEMEDGLAGAGAVVEDGAVAGEEIFFGGEFRGDHQELAEERLVFGWGVVKGFKMFARAEEDVYGSLRADVFKSEEIGVFVDKFRGNFFRADFAEEAIFVEIFRSGIGHGLAPATGGSSRRRTIGVNPSLARNCSPNSRAASSPETLPTRTRKKVPSPESYDWMKMGE